MLLPNVENDLRAKLAVILEPGGAPDYIRWCGCYEGDMDDSFPVMRDKAVNEIIAMIDWMSSMGFLGQED